MTGGVPGAETIADVTARMVPALREMLASLAPGETGIVVSHGACIKSSLMALLGLPPESEEVIFSMDNCGWATIAEHHGGRLRLGSYNETSHPGVLPRWGPPISHRTPRVASIPRVVTPGSGEAMGLWRSW